MMINFPTARILHSYDLHGLFHQIYVHNDYGSTVTLDLLSQGRAEMVVGRGSSIEAFPLFGLRLEDYDSLFAENLDLLPKIRDNEHVYWSGKYRPTPEWTKD